MMMALAQGATGLFKTISGASRRSRARDRREQLMADMPEFETPQSIEQLTSLYGDYLSQVERQEGLPGQEQMEANIRESTAQGIQDIRETARTSTQALGATTDVIDREIESIQQLEIEGARQQARRELQARELYGQALGNQAQYEEQAWRYNEFMPWRTELAQAQANVRGGQRTFESGLGDLVSAGTQYLVSNAEGSNTQDTEGPLPADILQFEQEMEAGKYDLNF